MTGRALVLGASGHVGNAMLRELLARGYAVTAARRGRTASANLAGLPISDAIGDADEPGTLARWTAGHALVVDAAAPYAMTLADRAVVTAAARRAALLVDAIARHGAHLVHVGSFVTRLGADADGVPHEPGQRLDSALHPYFAAKRAGEAVLDAAARAGAPITIVHPTTCQGPWDSRPAEMSLVPRALAGLVPVAPQHIINVVDVRDVARGAITAAERGYRGEPLRLSGHNIAIPELCGLIGELAGIRVTTRGIPAGLARAGAWAIELAAPGAVMPPPLLSTLLSLRQCALPVGAAQRAMAAAPRPLSTTLRDTIAWYRHIEPPPRAAGPRPTVI